jgi:hypothetical protein
MSVRFTRIREDHTARRGKRVFSADVEINGRGYYFATRANDIIEALEAFCMRLRRDFRAELERGGLAPLSVAMPQETTAAITMNCPQCEDCGWICEEHPGRPWEGPHTCTCGAAGIPCPTCNQPAQGEMPRMPEGFRTEVDKDGWRN